MAKQVGFPISVTVDNVLGVPQDISCDITNFTFNTSRGEQNVTGLCKDAMERLMLLADGQASFNGVFNPSANASHDVLSTVTSTAINRTVVVSIGSSGSAPTTGDPQLSMEMLFTAYDITRGADGALTWSCKANISDGNVPLWGVVP